MKRILTLIVAIIAMACSKSKEDHSALYGEWAFQSEVENGKEIQILCNEYSYIIITESTCEIHRFRESGEGCKEDVIKANYNVSGNQLSIENEGQKISFSYVVKGDILTITSPSGVVTSYKKNARKTPPAVPANPFIGSWKLEQSLDNGVDDTNDCSQKSTIVIADNTITVNSSYINSGNCVSEKFEFTYSYTNGKITNIKDQENGKVVDSFITFALENGFLVITQVDDNSTTIDKYKKQ